VVGSEVSWSSTAASKQMGMPRRVAPGTGFSVYGGSTPALYCGVPCAHPWNRTTPSGFATRWSIRQPRWAAAREEKSHRYRVSRRAQPGPLPTIDRVRATAAGSCPMDIPKCRRPTPPSGSAGLVETFGRMSGGLSALHAPRARLPTTVDASEITVNPAAAPTTARRRRRLVGARGAEGGVDWLVHRDGR
jgi:hypothetical protein